MNPTNAGEAEMPGTILIVDDVATNRIVLKVKLTGACYGTLQARTGEEALRIARHDQPDVILLDLQLPDMDGIDVCRRLKADPATRAIPVLMLTAFDDREARMAALRAGADDFLSKPIDELPLLARVRSVLRARATAEELRMRETTGALPGFADPAAGFSGAPVASPVAPPPGMAADPPGHPIDASEGDPEGVIALVMARREDAMAIRRTLAVHLPDTDLRVLAREEALAGDPAAAGADVFLIDLDHGGRGGGLRLMSEIQSRPATHHAAICVLLPDGATEAGAMALDLGAADLLSRSADPQETALRLLTQIRRKRQADRLRASVRDGLRLAMTDPLTGLHNRRYAFPQLAAMAERARRTGQSYAVMVLDIDSFKAVNDTHGHAAGDAVLVELSRRLRAAIRDEDLLARIGGEEFLLALPGAGPKRAREVAERLLRAIAGRAMRLPGAPEPIRVTVSIGLAIGGREDPSCGVEAVFDRADRALLSAKAGGRNNVTAALSPAA